MKATFLTLLFFFILSFGFAQNKIDSLEIEIAQATTDSLQINLRNQLFYNVVYSNPKKGLSLARKSLAQSKKLGVQKWKGECHSMLSEMPTTL